MQKALPNRFRPIPEAESTDFSGFLHNFKRIGNIDKEDFICVSLFFCTGKNFLAKFVLKKRIFFFCVEIRIVTIINGKLKGGLKGLARYSDEIINEVFAENDIVDYISQYVQLKKTGRDYSGLCPFHKEKSPSFHVSREKQLYHCFGCNASGNLVQFVMRTEGLDFTEALKLLADRAGIVLPEEDNRVDHALHQKKQRIYQMNQMAARFFHKELTQDAAGKKALEYFQKRKLTPATIRSYGLGYAPDDYTALLRHMQEAGFTPDELAEAGLVTKREDRYFDRFRDRVIFPIIDLRSNVIGFGGRIMGEAKEVNGYKPPKYLNSAETPVFHKGRNLFSLNLAKKAAATQLLLVEGYMDVISVYQAGVKNVVATLGTALTEDQAKLLMKYCNEILICYDTDEAGQKATVRATEIINNVGGKARIVRLKGSKDPDEYIKAYGIASFREALSEAIPATQYRISLVRGKYNLDTPEGKVSFVSEVADILCSLQDAVEVDAYIRQIASETEISKEAIYSEYKKKAVRANRIKTQQQQLRPIRSSTEEEGEISGLSAASSKAENAEKKLLNLIVQSKKFTQKAAQELTPEDFSHPVCARLAELIFSAVQNGTLPEPAVLVSDFEGEEMKYAAAVFYNLETYSDDEKTLAQLIESMKREKLLLQIKQESDPKKINELFQQLSNLGGKKNV